MDIKQNVLSNINYQKLLRTNQDTNKGTYGTVAIIGGDRGMLGALCLSGRAALLCGAGKIILAPLDERFIFEPFTPELMVQSPKRIIKNLQSINVIAIGPGLGKSKGAVKILNNLFDALIKFENIKLIVDADALNIIAENTILQNKFKPIKNKILTPHPGEAARILNTTVANVQNNRVASITNIITLLNGVVILKGHESLIADKNNLFINQTGNSSLSNAGQGDTLTGIIASFLAQGLTCLEAARFGALIHGLAGDELVIKKQGFNGVIASEVAKEASNLINKLLHATL